MSNTERKNVVHCVQCDKRASHSVGLTKFKDGLCPVCISVNTIPDSREGTHVTFTRKTNDVDLYWNKLTDRALSLGFS